MATSILLSIYTQRLIEMLPLEINHSQVTMKDAQNCDRALQVIAESQKGKQEQR